MSTVAARRAQLTGAVLALGVAAYLILQLSVAAFTDTATNSGNSFASGAVEISESNAGTAMFNATNIVPGWELTESVTVDNDSSVDTEVALYVSDLQDTGLAPFLEITVTRDAATVYSGALTGMPQDFAAATPVAETPSTQSTYEFTVSMPEGQANVNDAQNTTATVAFTWEARSVAP